MPIGFPTTPTIGQQWPTVSPRWEWDGTKWTAIAGSGTIAATPITERLTSLTSTDDSIWLRGGVPYLASAAAQASYFGVTPAATAPAALTVGQWSAEPTATPGEIGINIATLPSDGGSAITALEYRIGTGAAVALTGTGTGLRVVTAGFTAGVAAAIQVRAVNAVDANPDNWSDTKTRTPASAPAGGSINYVGAGATYTQYSAQTTHTVAVPAGMQAGDMLIVVGSEQATVTAMETSTTQALVNRVTQRGTIWSVVIAGAVPTTVTVTLSVASEFRARALAYRGVTQVAGTTNEDIIATPRSTLLYSSDAANAAVVIAYSRPSESVTAATFNGADAADSLTKFDFADVGIVAGIHDGATGSNSASVTWSAADTGGRYISVAFKA